MPSCGDRRAARRDRDRGRALPQCLYSICAGPPGLSPSFPGRLHACACHNALPERAQPAVLWSIPMPVTALNSAACGRVEGFVRDALGCTCPPAVFGDIRLETDPASFPEIPGSRLLAIGGRLLVLLVDGRVVDMAAPQISTLLRRGRKLRDAGGFKRFRLVIVTPQAGSPGMPVAIDLDSVVREDDRLHLHTIAPAQLPALLRASAEAQ
jgi:hypothetical protein